MADSTAYAPLKEEHEHETPKTPFDVEVQPIGYRHFNSCRRRTILRNVAIVSGITVAILFVVILVAVLLSSKHSSNKNGFNLPDQWTSSFSAQEKDTKSRPKGDKITGKIWFNKDDEKYRLDTSVVERGMKSDVSIIVKDNTLYAVVQAQGMCAYRDMKNIDNPLEGKLKDWNLDSTDGKDSCDWYKTTVEEAEMDACLKKDGTLVKAKIINEEEGTVEIAFSDFEEKSIKDNVFEVPKNCIHTSKKKRGQQALPSLSDATLNRLVQKIRTMQF